LYFRVRFGFTFISIHSCFRLLASKFAKCQQILFLLLIPLNRSIVIAERRRSILISHHRPENRNWTLNCIYTHFESGI
jgi:hypothetical protein